MSVQRLDRNKEKLDLKPKKEIKEAEEMIDTAWSVINQLLPYIDKHKSKI